MIFSKRKKLITLTEDSELVSGCMRCDRYAEEELYRRFSPDMMKICLRYAENHDEAEDMMQEGFIKVFTRIHTFRGQGSLEGWIRRIIVHEAINILRKKKAFHIREDLNQLPDTFQEKEEEESKEISTPSPSELLKLVQSMPTGYRTVFNLFVFESFSHREIAIALGISENTSKTQLMKARKYLLRQLNEQNIHKPLHIHHA